MSYLAEVQKTMLTETSNSQIEDHSAFITEIYDENYRGLQKFAITQGCRKEEAADVVNSAFCNFIAYMKNRGWQNTIGKPFSFLATTVRRLIIDKRNHEQAEKFVSIDDYENHYEPSDKGRTATEVNREMDDREYFDTFLRPYMDGFSKHELDLIWHLVIKDHKPKDIAEILDENYKHTSIDCNRVMAKLRSRLKKRLTRRS